MYCEQKYLKTFLLDFTEIVENVDNELMNRYTILVMFQILGEL